MSKSMELGGGGRFEAIENKAKGEGHSEGSAKKIAASAGIKAHGKHEMNALAHRARMKVAHHMRQAGQHMAHASHHMGMDHTGY